MAMLSNRQLRFAYGLLFTVLLALGISDPLSAQTSDESEADDKKEEAQVTILLIGRSVTSRFRPAHSQPLFFLPRFISSVLMRAFW